MCFSINEPKSSKIINLEEEQECEYEQNEEELHQELLEQSHEFALILISYIKDLKNKEQNLSMSDVQTKIYDKFSDVFAEEILTFTDASIVDFICLGTKGLFWGVAYGFPKENDYVKIGDYTLKAIDVGYLTFGISI